MCTSEVRVKCAPKTSKQTWHYVKLCHKSQTVSLSSGEVSRIDEPGIVYQAPSFADAHTFAKRLACSTGALYSAPVQVPAVSARGKAIEHRETQDRSALPAIRPTIRAAYPWERI
jgi:hypothetical protein